jgi:glucosamine-6-phosphate deaminase
VPLHAITLTLPVFLQARALSVVVSGPRKAAAVRDTCGAAISTACPATILRCRTEVMLFIDEAAGALLPGPRH